MAINYVKLKTTAFHFNTAALHPKMVLFEKYQLKCSEMLITCLRLKFEI